MGNNHPVKRIFLLSTGAIICLVLLGVFTIYKISPNTSVESIGYQYAVREDISNLPALATPAGYTSLNPQSIFSGKNRIQKLAQTVVAGETSELGKANALIYWVQLHVRPQTSAPTTVITDDYVNVIKRGWGYCDQMAHVFATMATYVGLDAAQLQLFRNDGVSPHTLALVMIEGKWRLASTWRGIIPLNYKGEPYTVSGFIKRLEKGDAYEFASTGITAEEFKNSRKFSTFPYVSNVVFVKKIFSRVKQKITSPSISSNSTNSPKREPSLRLQAKVKIPHADLVSYDKARDAHIDLRFSLAEHMYEKVINATNSDVLRDEAKFQEAMAYFDADQNSEALKKFQSIVNDKQDSAWKISAMRMSAETLVRMGEVQRGLKILDKIDTVQSKVRAKQLRLARNF